MKSLYVALMVVVLLGVSSVQANLLSNADFEIGTVERSDTSFDCPPWERDSFGNKNAWLENAPGGGKAIKMRWENIFIQQDFSAQAGFTYEFSIDTYQESGNKEWRPTISVEWYDASDEIVGARTDVVEIDPEDSGDPNDGVEANTWYRISGLQTAPSGTVSGRMILRLYRTENLGGRKPCFFDNASCQSIGAGNPNPANGSGVDPSITSELSWDNPVTADGNDLIWELWWGGTEPNQAFWTLEGSGIAASGSTSSAPVPETLSLDNTYHWRVDIGIDVNDLTSLPWMFNTINGSPAVDAGDNVNIWLSGGSATLPLNGIATDDGLPNPPANLEHTWTSVPSAGVSFVDNTDPTTNVTFTAVGTYTLTLEADDSVLSAADSITVEVSAEGDQRLLASYEFEGNADDSSGNGHHGTLTGDPNLPEINTDDSKVGTGSLYINEISQAVEIMDSNSLDPNAPAPTWADFATTGQFTISAWAKIEAWGNWGSIIDKGAGYALHQNNNLNHSRARVGLFSTFNLVAVPDDADGIPVFLPDGNWHHIAGTYDGNKMLSLYVDGILEAKIEDTINATIPQDIVTVLGIGRGLSNGRIDQVRIHDLALTGDMIWDQFIADGGSNSCRQLYTPGDLSQDCYTDVDDLELLAAQWITVYDLSDYALMAAEWLECIDQTDPACSPL